ncbi:MAG: hypothetical protein GY796_31810 [Chloroflexi bacterium]|nr:hypothetical protein [Chloroflexota bacterium]
MDKTPFCVMEMGGGQVNYCPSPTPTYTLQIPPTTQGYTDAQIDDYGRPYIHRRRDYPWQQGVRLTCRARFSHGRNELKGTAGFGFWNAPFADPKVKWPTLPQAVWFFFGSPPNNLPLAQSGPAQGWYAAVLDAMTLKAAALIPLAPFVLLANQVTAARQRIWPGIQQQMGIAHALLTLDMQAWHDYCLDWVAGGCVFEVDGRIILKTSHSPHGPLGFVCWIDNQYLALTPRGYFRWGTLSTDAAQWLQITSLSLTNLTLKMPA